MLKSMLIALSALVLFCIPLEAANAQTPVEDLMQDCSKEINQYCSSVTPGEGRLVSCAKAYEDKLSSNCKYAINRASYWLDYLARSLTYVADQCEADTRKFCSGVKPGDGRILDCLRENKTKLNKYCGFALKDIGKE